MTDVVPFEYRLTPDEAAALARLQALCGAHTLKDTLIRALPTYGVEYVNGVLRVCEKQPDPEVD
jgi:hypothetical protein